MIDPVSFLIGMLWGGSTFLSYSIVLWDRWDRWRKMRDRRSRRELVAMVPLWIVSLLFGLVLFLSVIRDVADVGASVRALLFGITCGVFTAAGVMSALDVIAYRRRGR